MPPGIAGLPLSSSGSSEIMASVVSIKQAIDAAFCNAVRVTLLKRASRRKNNADFS
jgi:hypothetical protein